MAKTQLIYTEKGKKPRTGMFRCMGDAREYLGKLEKALNTQPKSEAYGKYLQIKKAKKGDVCKNSN